MSVETILPRAAALVSRRVCYTRNGYGYGTRYYNCNSAWYRWGRWVLAGVLIFIGIILLLVIAFCASRRRRRSRYQTSTPMTTQPAAGGYYNNNQAYQPPAGAPPTYGGNYEGGYNQGYYGQQGGVTQPQNVYVK